MAGIGQPNGQQFYCELNIKGNQYNSLNINYLVIREWVMSILPTIEIQFLDEGYLTEAAPLEDGEDIIVTLAKHEKDDKPLVLTFSMNDYEVGILGDNRKTIVTMTGILKVADMYTTKNRSFSRRNSASVLESIAQEAAIKFDNPNKVTPTDNMIWYQSSISNFAFIKHVLKRSFIPDDLPLFYATTDNKFIFTSLISELNKQEAKLTKFSVENFEMNVKDDSDKDKTIWFNSYDIVNYSGFYNKQFGYGVKYDYYDLDRGREVVYSKITKKTDLSFRNKEFVNPDKPTPVFNRISGDLITANVYGSDYFEAYVKNKFLLHNFFAMGMILNINALDEVKLMDKLHVDVPSQMAENQTNEVLSGEYLVAGVQHEVSNGGYYKKKISVHRNGMNKSSIQNIYQVEE
jgi:hypothetical protein